MKMSYHVLQIMRTDLKSKEAKLSSTTALLENANKQLEQANSQVVTAAILVFRTSMLTHLIQVKRLETDKSSTTVQTRRASVTPHKRESIRIGTTHEVDPLQRWVRK